MASGMQLFGIAGPGFVPILTGTSLSGFLPTSLSNCQFWYDANDLATITLSGSNVTNWNDKSGNGRNLARITTPGPFLTSNFNGSFRCVESISASNGGMRVFSVPSSAMQGASGSTYFLTFNYLSGTVITQYAEPRFLSMEGSNRYDYGPLGANVIYNLPAGSTFLSPQTFCLALNVPGSNLTSFQNGFQRRSDTVTPITIAYTKDFGLLAISDGNLPAYVRLAEFIGYNRLLSASEREQVEGYLSQKWGLQQTLPLIQPYRSLPFLISKTFTPLSIANSSLWVDAADSTTITLSGSSVTSVRDKAQSLTLTTQGTTSLLTVTNSINSRQTLYFNNSAGNSVYLQGTFANLTAGSFFVVWQAATQLSTGYRALYAWQSVGSLTFPVFGYVNSLTLVGPYTTFVGPGTPTTNVSAGTNYLTFYSWTGTTTNVGFNGAIPTAGTQSAYASSSSVFTIMGELDGSIDTVHGYIGEMVFYSRVLATGERQNVEGYLAWKWGLQTNLPTTHPFRNFPPPPL